MNHNVPHYGNYGAQICNLADRPEMAINSLQPKLPLMWKCVKLKKSSRACPKNEFNWASLQPNTAVSVSQIEYQNGLYCLSNTVGLLKCSGPRWQLYITDCLHHRLCMCGVKPEDQHSVRVDQAYAPTS